MNKLRGAFFSLSEHIPAARWCLSLIVISFTAVVSVFKYIDLAETAAFSAFEALFLILTDTMNIVFIYLPLYLFVVCGIMFDNGFGGIEILRCGSRGRWLTGKLLTYLLNTLIFFIFTLIINLAVCSAAFNKSDVWSGAFVGFRVMMGQPAGDFAYPPLPTISAACAALFMFYAMCGTINMLISLITDRESAALFGSLLAGIALGLLNMLIGTNDIISQLVRFGVLFSTAAVLYAVSLLAIRRKDFKGSK